MAQTGIDICNQALVIVGAQTISAFDDGSNEGEKCGLLYETCVRGALLTPGNKPKRWSFASRQERLSRLVDTPEGRWDVAWQMPTLCLKIHAITANDIPVPFDLYGDKKIFTDEYDELICDHTYRPDETFWPGDFEDAIVQEMARRLAMALRDDADLAAELRRGNDWSGARTADSQQRTTKRLRATRLISRRFG